MSKVRFLQPKPTSSKGTAGAPGRFLADSQLPGEPPWVGPDDECVCLPLRVLEAGLPLPLESMTYRPASKPDFDDASEPPEPEFRALRWG